MKPKLTMWIGAAAMATAALVPAALAARQHLPTALFALRSEARGARVAGTVARSAQGDFETIVVDETLIVATRRPGAALATVTLAVPPVPVCSDWRPLVAGPRTFWVTPPLVRDCVQLESREIPPAVRVGHTTIVYPPSAPGGAE